MQYHVWCDCAIPCVVCFIDSLCKIFLRWSRIKNLTEMYVILSYSLYRFSISVHAASREASVEVIQLDVARTFPQLCIFQKVGDFIISLHPHEVHSTAITKRLKFYSHVAQKISHGSPEIGGSIPPQTLVITIHSFIVHVVEVKRSHDGLMVNLVCPSCDQW